MARGAALSEHREIEALVLDALKPSLLLVIALTVAFDYINGFHASAQPVTTSVATQPPGRPLLRRHPGLPVRSRPRSHRSGDGLDTDRGQDRGWVRLALPR